jgi:hypothetical protein
MEAMMTANSPVKSSEISQKSGITYCNVAVQLDKLPQKGAVVKDKLRKEIDLLSVAQETGNHDTQSARSSTEATALVFHKIGVAAAESERVPSFQREVRIFPNWLP